MSSSHLQVFMENRVQVQFLGSLGCQLAPFWASSGTLGQAVEPQRRAQGVQGTVWSALRGRTFAATVFKHVLVQNGDHWGTPKWAPAAGAADQRGFGNHAF